MPLRRRSRFLIVVAGAVLALIAPVSGAHATIQPASVGTSAGPAAVASSSAAYLCARVGYGVGFRGSALTTAVAVALAESSCNPSAKGYNGPTSGCPNGSTDRGLWQINNCYHPDVSDSCAYNSACNARAAWAISSHGTDWTPWSTYDSGAYRSHLSEASAAITRLPAEPGDYSGDGKIDPAVWRPSTGVWYFHGTRSNFSYGVNGDIPVAADYNGDGKIDPAVWRPSTGHWYFHGTIANTTYGVPGDIPVPADYNGDGKVDLAVWRPSTGVWYLHGVAANTTYGEPGDIPVPADYNGDGRADLALWRPSTGVWYFHGARPNFSYGVRGDIPVPADYTGDGIADPAVWRPSSGVWYFHGALGNITYGVRGDVPQPGNLDGDGASELAVWRPSTGAWYFNGLRTAFLYGVNGDIPVSSLVLNAVVLHRYGLV